MNENIEINQLSNLVNSYYVLVEASDLLLREAEKKLYKQGRGLRHEIKHRHSLLMQEVQRMKNINESFFKDYVDVFTDDLGIKYDEIRYTASYFAKLTLLVADRCCDSDNWQKENHIAEFIKNMPSHNFVSDETINNLTIK